MTVSFGLTNAGNDWWWGIDDVEISGRDSDTGDAAGVPPPVGTLSLLHESFEGLELQTPVHERSCTDKKSWTAKPPSGWSVDNRNMATGGMDDFRGWTFMLQDHWQMYVTRKKNLFFSFFPFFLFWLWVSFWRGNLRTPVGLHWRGYGATTISILSRLHST